MMRFGLLTALLLSLGLASCGDVTGPRFPDSGDKDDEPGREDDAEDAMLDLRDLPVTFLA